MCDIIIPPKVYVFRVALRFFILLETGGPTLYLAAFLREVRKLGKN